MGKRKNKAHPTVPTQPIEAARPIEDSRVDANETIMMMLGKINSAIKEMKQAIADEFKAIRDDINVIRDDISRFKKIFFVFALATVITAFCYYALMISYTEFVRDRAETLERVSSESTFPNCSKVTTFGLYFEGKVMEATVSHARCTSPPSYLVPCAGIDVALAARCPTTGFALNGHRTTPLYIGERVVTFGFGDISKVWSGEVSSLFDKNETHFSPFNDQANLPADTLIVNGDQNRGMSGAAVLNSYGLAGIASSIIRGSYNSSRLVAVIPIHHLLRCVKTVSKSGVLPTKQECHAAGKKVTVINPPILFSVETSVKILKRMAWKSLEQLWSLSEDLNYYWQSY